MAVMIGVKDSKQISEFHHYLARDSTLAPMANVGPLIKPHFLPAIQMTPV